jgi:V8-like Glu-specific endopeptidase
LERFPLNQGPDTEGQATGGGEGFNYVMPYNNFRTGVNNSYPYSTVGKLFFVIPKGASEAPGDYVCSGSVALDSHTVITARHCMYDITNHVWYGSWAFYPEWTVNFAYTWVGTGNPNWYWDIGLLSMHDHDGKGCNNSTGSKTIGDYTGWLGWWYGENFSQVQWNIFGYPQASPFEGNYLYQDNAATGELNPFGNSGIVEVGNPQTGGTSGGPWILGFDPNNGTDGAAVDNINGDKNLVNAVNSFKWTDPNLPLTINSAGFQANNMNDLYNNYKGFGHCP